MGRFSYIKWVNLLKGPLRDKYPYKREAGKSELAMGVVTLKTRSWIKKTRVKSQGMQEAEKDKEMCSFSKLP